MKVAKLLMFTFLLSSLLVGQASAFPWDTPETHRWWFRSDTDTVNGIFGYLVNETQTSTGRNVSSSLMGDNQTWWALRVWVRRSNNSTVELTDGTYNVNVTRTVGGEGLQNVSWTPSLTNLYLGADALRINAYSKIGSDSWQLKATFVTERLETNQIVNSTWTFRLYTSRNIPPPATFTFLSWGNSTYASRIDGVQLAQLSPFETMTFHLRNSNFIGFLFTPWTYYLGNGFWGIMLLFGVVTMYNRYNRIEPVIVLCWIFGGSGGILTLLIPSVALHISWFFLAFGLGASLYLLFR